MDIVLVSVNVESKKQSEYLMNVSIVKNFLDKVLIRIYRSCKKNLFVFREQVFFMTVC